MNKNMNKKKQKKKLIIFIIMFIISLTSLGVILFLENGVHSFCHTYSDSLEHQNKCHFFSNTQNIMENIGYIISIITIIYSSYLIITLKIKKRILFIIIAIISILITPLVTEIISDAFNNNNNLERPVAKPIIYLYPTQTTNIKVSLEKENILTTTYPKYNNGWEVTAHPNGDLFDKNNNYYYALYWEGINNDTVNFKEGFYVKSTDSISFLEEKLTFLGLNDKEKNEFIMYWLPKMEHNGNNLVYFDLTEECQKQNKLNIEPNPDSLLRIKINIKKIKKKIDIKEEKLTSFKRTGFSVIEWGGTLYN